MSITNVPRIYHWAICAMHPPPCKILNTPVMSICLVKQNDGTWVEKHQRFFIQRLQTLFIFVTFF